MLRNIRNRYFGYCAPLAEQSSLDFRFNALNFDELTHFDEKELLNTAVTLDKFLAQNSPHEVITLSQRTERAKLGSDIAPIGGYGTFICDVVGRNVPIKFGKIVRKVRVCTIQSEEIVVVDCQDGHKYCAMNAICTVPLVVLKSLHLSTSINFRSERHNKVILKFKEEDIFWPHNLLQFNNTEPCVRFTNLHAVGMKGILIAPILGSEKKFSDVSRLSYEDVVKDILNILKKFDFDEDGHGCTLMSRSAFREDEDFNEIKSSFEDLRLSSEFKAAEVPAPISTLATRWEDDPFACGSYSYCPSGNALEDATDWLEPEKLGTDRDMLFLAGEHTVDGGNSWQCASGAANFELRAAYQILTRCSNLALDMKDLYENLNYLPHPPLHAMRDTKTEVQALNEKISALEKMVENLKRENAPLNEDLDEKTLRTNQDEGDEPLAQETYRNNAREQAPQIGITEGMGDPVGTVMRAGNDQLGITIVAVRQQDSNWKLIQVPIIQNVRQRVNCIHQDR